MQIMYLITSVYVNVDQECKIEDIIYDLSCFCFDHDCTWQTLLQNEMGKVFQVTGSLNALAALFYDPEPNNDDHKAFFDLYSSIGAEIGKITRWTLAFDPTEINY